VYDVVKFQTESRLQRGRFCACAVENLAETSKRGPVGKTSTSVRNQS